MARSRQLGMLAEALGKAGHPESGLAVIEEAQGFSARSGEVYFAAELLRLRGELLLQQDREAHRAAQGAFLEAVETARAQQARSWELRAATSLARLWAGCGERSKAHHLLGPILDWFTEGFETPDLADAKVLLETLA